jgi:osmotically-inducible protein OsmY
MKQKQSNNSIMKNKRMVSLCLAFCLGIPTIVTLFAGCAADRNNRSTGEYIDDKALAMRVSGALNDNEEYKLASVEVKAFRGTIQLSGFVNTEDQKDKAGEIAKKVQGVENVENNIQIKSKITQNQ